MKDVGTYILCPVGRYYGYFVYFLVIWYIFPFWYVVVGKIWQPWPPPLTPDWLQFPISM
jgi:hypothetical protein